MFGILPHLYGAGFLFWFLQCKRRKRDKTLNLSVPEKKEGNKRRSL